MYSRKIMGGDELDPTAGGGRVEIEQAKTIIGISKKTAKSWVGGIRGKKNSPKEGEAGKSENDEWVETMGNVFDSANGVSA